MNNQLVKRQMPILIECFGKDVCDTFITTKEQPYTKYGDGPWALVINGQLTGWVGLQSENKETNLILVLHPNYRGKGKNLYKELIDSTLSNMISLKSMTILFPSTKTRIKGFLRLQLKK
ncbi:GNAT family N-acetyltransferase [Flavivirga algicola]|uniref:GNAT family N-acetyltransferase n=1 Tax=Flavivirga algicola TaxID=2729136 RepID=A0ABX1RS40_9FLAO|nr:GNAT family N-acetyltransferase [Flavivirga algicola]NMH85986.1 GNAT family N-acetyltransferase [Flavivirga algicola]